MSRRRVTAVIWDFDGTLADTLDRNLEITRRIVEQMLGGSATRFAALRDREAYGRAVHTVGSWRELYVREFGVPLERTAEAAPLWSALHEGDTDVPPLFEGVEDVVRGLDDRLQGIVSQNGRDNIEHALGVDGLLRRFTTIVADEDLPFDRQKPAPDGLLHCAEELHGGLDLAPASTVLYVGDHPVDVECVRRAARELVTRGHRWRVLSVGVEYGRDWRRPWPESPDFVVSRPAEILDLVEQIDGRERVEADRRSPAGGQ